MPGGHNPCDPIKRVGGRVIVALGQRWADVESYAHADGRAGLPTLCRERALGRQCRRDRLRRQAERRLEGIADHLIGMPAMRGDGQAHDRIMVDEG
jgi:hypothetical protein